MEGVIARPKQSYVFDHKLTDSEVRELIDNFDYEAYEAVASDDDYEPGPVWDQFGNPTIDTIAAKYEVEHGLLEEPMTLDEFHDWLHAIMSEDD